jgi:hypothetical protein
MTGMNFGQALEALKDGKRCARHGWNGKGLFIFLVKGSKFLVNREPLLSHFGEGYEIDYKPHIDMKAVDGSISVWTASQTDIMAEDWVIV